MSILTVASFASVWRGYDYWEGKMVDSWKKISDSRFEGVVKGSDNNKYQVTIDLEHPRKSACNCPHADGRRVVCKHQVALFFTVFPKEAKKYMKEIEEYEEEMESIRQDRYNLIEEYVNGLSDKEVRVALINALIAEEDEDYYY